MPDELEQPAGTLDSDAAGSTAAEDYEATGQHDDHDDADSQEQAAEEEEELEVGERKIALPKSLAAQLKSERMMQADYTQKTQTLAEERRQHVAERERFQADQVAHQQHIKEVAKVEYLNDQLAQFDALNWDEIIANDPQQAMQLQERRRALESQRTAAQQDITTKLNDRALSQQQAFAKQVQDAEAYIAREIKGCNPERIKALEQYAGSRGIDVRQFAKSMIETPAFAVFVHKAEQFDALQKKQAPKPPAAPAATPALKVGSNASVKKDPAAMTDKEYSEWRRAQIRNRK